MRACALFASVSALVLSTSAVAQDACYVVGTWNLEHFRADATRGFPERAGQISPRSASDIEAIASAIRDTMRARLLTLQEINGRGTSSTTSDEMDELVAALGGSYRYQVARSGGSQRAAFLWDEEFIRINQIFEINIPNQEIQNSDIFARNPFVAHATLLENGQPRNDFVFVGLHLASGQQLTQNHDAAMDRLFSELNSLEGSNSVFPAGEKDILIGGDLNASWYDTNVEQFFSELNSNGWRVMARPGAGYPSTRVNGSQIDYLIATHQAGSFGGLIRDEIEDDEAIVWHGLAWNGRFKFRDVFSDHFPVTTCVRSIADTD
jgi:endonuclease/exonuclease/phosphatase family metal-dependent hydrolase